MKNKKELELFKSIYNLLIIIVSNPNVYSDKTGKQLIKVFEALKELENEK